MKCHRLPYLLILTSVLLFTGCSHSNMVEMQKNQAKKEYLTGHGNRDQYQEDLRNIEAASEEWRKENKPN